MRHRSSPRSAMRRASCCRFAQRAWALPLVLLAAAGPAAALQRVYVANINGGTVAVLDADRRGVIASIPVGRQPDGIAATRDGRTVYVSNFADATVSVIDTASDTVVATIPVDLGPVGIAVQPGGDEVYVACKVARTLVVIDAPSRTVAASIGIGQGPNDVAVAPDRVRVYVSRSEGSTVAVLDSRLRQQVGLLEVGPVPNRLALSPDGSQLFVTLFRKSQVVRVPLAGGDPVSDYVGTRPAGIAVSRDGRSLYVSDQESSVRRLDATTLETLDGTCGGTMPYGLLALPSGAVLVASMGDDTVRFINTTGPDAANVAGGPFALAALPPETPALDVAIESPEVAAHLATGAAVPVRISVREGTRPLQRWTLRLRALDPPGQDTLATDTAPVTSGVVATIAADKLQAGVHYELTLSAAADDDTQVVRTTPLFVPERPYALVPLEPVRDDPYAAGPVMDGSGGRFARFDPLRADVALYDADSGAVTHVQPPLPFTSGHALQLSRSGERLALSGEVAASGFTSGVLDLDSRIFSSIPSLGAFDLDAAGNRVATVSFRDHGWNYDLTDIGAGTVTAITDLPTLEDLPPTCRPFSVGTPRLSADGNTVAFATILPLGGPPGCDLYTYDAASGSRRFVRGFGDQGPVRTPSMDDAGEHVALLLPPLDPDADGPLRLEVLDLASGVSTPLLADTAPSILDAVLSGDGASVVFSSCADLDPAVGNPDFNLELFRVELATGHVTQITDTHGGPRSCFSRGGEPLSPSVSRGADVVAFRGQGFGPLYCGNPGPQRDRHSGLAFGLARAVPIVAGNQSPTVDLPAGVATEVGAPFDVFVRGSDPDGDPLSYFADFDELGGLPPNSEFVVYDDEQDFQARFTWSNPGPADVGEHALRIGAFDGRGGDAVQTVRVVVCRFLSRDPVGDVVTAIFGSQPAACGSGDANGDGIASAADLVVSR